jgi:Rrf2 family protein
MLVPRAYLSKVLQDLGKRGIVRLKPGVGGGVVLVADPEKLTLLDVIQTVEGRMAFNRCVYAPGECALSCSCPVHAFWNQLQKVIEEQVGGKTFAELAKGCSTESFKKTRAHSLNERSSRRPTGGEPWPI